MPWDSTGGLDLGLLILFVGDPFYSHGFNHSGMPIIFKFSSLTASVSELQGYIFECQLDIFSAGQKALQTHVPNWEQDNRRGKHRVRVKQVWDAAAALSRA